MPLLRAEEINYQRVQELEPIGDGSATPAAPCSRIRQGAAGVKLQDQFAETAPQASTAYAR